MIFDLAFQFLLELFRALLVDELSERVRRHVRHLGRNSNAASQDRAFWHAHRRNRERLLNKLLTEIDDDL